MLRKLSQIFARRPKRISLDEWSSKDRQCDQEWRECFSREDHEGCIRAMLRSEANSAAYFNRPRSNSGILILADEREVKCLSR